MKIKLAVRYPQGACSYYRSVGTFSKIPKIDDGIEIEVLNNTLHDWPFLADADIFYVERPQDAELLGLIKIAKNFNVPVWVDFDDNLLSLPKYNPGYDLYSKQSTIKCITESLELADVVTVATDGIKEAYAKHNTNIHVIPNAFNDYNYSLPKKSSENKIINWRGSNTHRGDLMAYLREMHYLNKKRDWLWSFVGADLWYVTDEMDKEKTYTAGESTMPRYMKLISERIKPGIQFSPLVFNDFNECKSNISWIEGVYSGACHVGPDMPEFRKPGIENYSTPAEFMDKIEMLMDSPELREDNFQKSLAYINDNLLLSKVNKKRIDIIRGMI